jgi:HlyD family secretion protein
MKTKHFWIFIITVFSACSGNQDRSDAYGNFEVDDVIVSAEASGKLLTLNVMEGEKIVKGQLVATIDTSDLILKRKQLKAQKNAVNSNISNITAQIEVQEQQKANLIIDKNRVEKMLKDGAATQKQLDDINGKIDLINKQISSIQTQKSSVLAEQEVINVQIDQVEENLQKCRIKNPIAGVVLDKFAQPGEITAFGKPLYKIASTDPIYIRVYVSGAQLPNIKLGQEVEVLVDKNSASNRKLNGIVSWISESAEFTPKIIQTKEERVNLVYAVKIRVPNDGSLKIGMPGEVNF